MPRVSDLALDEVPPSNVLRLDNHIINRRYRAALYERHPWYTVEEIVGSHLGYNPHFPSEEVWLREQKLPSFW